MTTVSTFRAVLIGSDSLLVECGEHLLAQGHAISHVVTDQPRIAEWARTRSLSVLDATGDYIARLAENEFDCLFSITWLSILPDEVLALPEKWAINFHDGPLPRYAGLYTPAWAIMEQAPRYGVTWHVMTSGVDRGELLEQEHFDVAPDETSLTINTRCFEAGVASFERLVAAIANDSVTPKQQDAGERSYFSKFQRPRAACTLDWNATATELEAQVRALDFGSYPNPLGTAKILGQSEVVSVTSARAVHFSGSPGQVLRIEADVITVATAEGALELTGFAHSCGAMLSPGELGRRWSLTTGDTLPLITEQQSTRLSDHCEQLARAEAFWVSRLERLEPLELPWAETRGPVAERKRGQVSIDLGSSRLDEPERVLAALGSYLARITGKTQFHLGFRYEQVEEFGHYVAPVVPVEFDLDLARPFASAIESCGAELERLKRRGSWMRDLAGRTPVLRDRAELKRAALLPVEIVFSSKERPYSEENAADLSFVMDVEASSLDIRHDLAALSTETVQRMASQLSTWFGSLERSGQIPGECELLPAAERDLVLSTWNDTSVDFPREQCVHTIFEERARAHPDAIAVASGEGELTYGELEQRSNQLAQHLVNLGICPGDMVGLHLERSVDLVVGVFGIMKAGGAYVPLDPEFPADRIAFMIQDARAKVLVTQASLLGSLAPGQAHVVCVDTDAELIASLANTPPNTSVSASDLAYAIYTSGSTGTPKGVLIEHRNVLNFFAGMDQRVGEVDNGVWLAVTSLSFDISVLELLWTACRGFKTVLYQGLRSQGTRQADAFDFGLSFFASNRNEDAATQYDFLLDSARFADRNGFASIWTPERHFHAFGGLYPNPSVTSAALAAITENVQLRSGSVVVALHHPVRIAEEWSLVDNLSKGRVGISIASGWHPNDFVLAPDNYADRKELMIENTRIVRRLWRGEAVDFAGPDGNPVPTSIMPRPIQPELPIWVTAAGNPETFRQAGELGANVLTHLLGQTTEELQAKIDVYREAWKTAGHPGQGSVSLMLHTFIGEDLDEVREIVREPMREYLRSAVDLIKNHVSSWSAVKKSVSEGEAPEIGSLEDLPPEDVEALLDYSFERYFETSALFGTPESALDMLGTLNDLGIDEITCLVDFGVPCQQVLESLPRLNELRLLANERFGKPAAAPESIDKLIAQHGVTHMQCTPSMASLLIEDEATAQSLKNLDVVMIGGEPFPMELARRLKTLVGGRLVNMYGPTETTIWSSTKEISADLERMTIGTPIANTQFYVLDANLQPMPIGATGELYIGGDGVTRGYHERPELTSERFVDNPFRSGERMYRTGDVARWLSTGEIDFQGRIDHQVKVRGYRIELGEIEARLAEHAEVAQAVVVATRGPEPTRLVAFLITGEDSAPTSTRLSSHLAESLPDYMIPEEVRFVETYPLTPNKKVDRNALVASLSERTPLPTSNIETQGVTVPPTANQPAAQATNPSRTEVDTDVIETLLAIWKDVLGVEACGPDENFFDLGGHSLLTIRVQKAIREKLGVSIPLVDMFRFTTVRTLAESMKPSEPQAGGETEAGPSRAAQRAAKRRRRAS